MSYVDPSGLKPGDKFNTEQEAACDALAYINPTSIKENLEYGRYIMKIGGKYIAQTPIKGKPAGVVLGPVPPNATAD